VIDASQAPKGSLYHDFPGGKRQLVIEALREAERTVGLESGTLLAMVLGARFPARRRAGRPSRPHTSVTRRLAT
jgi:hypothetical protein